MGNQQVSLGVLLGLIYTIVWYQCVVFAAVIGKYPADSQDL